MDFFEMFVRFCTKACFWIGYYTIGGIFRLLAFLLNIRTPEKTKAQTLDEKETARLAACQEMVLRYANKRGYIARECITREELDQKITQGITAEELAEEIEQRIWKKPGIVLGFQHFTEPTVEVKITDSWREKHAYIIGRSGSGKTTLLCNMLMQDFKAGNGVAVLAPEQEFLTEQILPHIPPDRIDDVVYVNPSDTDYPIPFNPLHLEEGADINLQADDAMTIFKRLMGETGARMDEILRQSLYALLERKGSTLLDFERLLSRTDETLRNEIIRTSQDPLTVTFFRDTYRSFPKDAHLPITTRIGRLIRPKTVRTLLCQPGKSFNFRQAMDEGKILLFNLSDGLLGEQVSQLLGQLIISKIQLAVMSRFDTPAKSRRPFYLYLDEFQTFTGVNETSYEKLLSRARKYRLGLILAHQQTGQLSTELFKEILGNVSTIITFSVSSADARRFSDEYVFSAGVETENIPPAWFLELKVGQAWGKIGTTIFPLRTIFDPKQPDLIRAKEVIERSRLNYGSKSDGDDPPPQTAGDFPDGLDPLKVF